MMRMHLMGLLACAFACACNPPSPVPEAKLSAHAVPAPPKPDPPLADGFDFPVGPPDAKGYYNAQGFQKNDHLGDDWNGRGGGNTDLGDPVHAIAHGLVSEAGDLGGGWGNVVRVIHDIGAAGQPHWVESLYAHLDTILVQTGDTVMRGQQIGTIGDAHGSYWAHLHLEIRAEAGLPLGGGYSTDTTGYLDPTAFIQARRPKR